MTMTPDQAIPSLPREDSRNAIPLAVEYTCAGGLAEIKNEPLPVVYFFQPGINEYSTTRPDFCGDGKIESVKEIRFDYVDYPMVDGVLTRAEKKSVCTGNWLPLYGDQGRFEVFECRQV